MKDIGLKTLFLLLLVAGWQVIVALEIWPDYLLPPPGQVASTLNTGIASGDYLLATGASLKRLAIGYALSVVLGISLGLLVARSRLAEKTIGTLILGLRTLPSVCWMPLALLWFGLDDTSIIFVTVAGSLPSITSATQTSIRQIPPLWVRAGRNMGATGSKLYLHVLLLAALPTVFEGMRQGWSFAWRSLMGGELLFVTAGLGHLLNMGRELNDMSQVLAVMILIVAIGLVTEGLLFSVAEKKLAARWGFKH